MPRVSSRCAPLYQSPQNPGVARRISCSESNTPFQMIYSDPCTNAEATLRHKTPLVAAGGIPPTSCRLNKPPMQGGAAILSLEPITADTYAFPTAPSSSGTTVRQRTHAQPHHLCPQLICALGISGFHPRRGQSIFRCLSTSVQWSRAVGARRASRDWRAGGGAGEVVESNVYLSKEDQRKCHKSKPAGPRSLVS